MEDIEEAFAGVFSEIGYRLPSSDGGGAVAVVEEALSESTSKRRRDEKEAEDEELEEEAVANAWHEGVAEKKGCIRASKVQKHPTGFPTWADCESWTMFSSSRYQKKCQCECGCTTNGRGQSWVTVAPATDTDVHFYSAQDMEENADEFPGEDAVDMSPPANGPYFAARNRSYLYYMVCEDCSKNFGDGSEHVCRYGPEHRLKQN